MRKILDKYNIKAPLLFKILLAVVLVAVVVLGVLYINSQRAEPMTIVGASDEEVTSENATLADTNAPLVTAVTTPQVIDHTSISDFIIVYVSGHVRNPGVFELAQGARLWQAIELAGGMTEYADENAINLASELVDEQHIIVFGIEDNMPPSIAQTQATGQAAATANSVININSATLAQLQTLSGIGEARARDIINHREARGGFARIEDIMNVPGIGEGIFARIRDSITVD